jgi:predicted ArsR family transcriptional regulator
METITELSALQERILSTIPKIDFIQLGQLAKSVGIYAYRVRQELKKLEDLGRVSVGRSGLPGAPLIIERCALNIAAKPNFDKLLFSTRWV